MDIISQNYVSDQDLLASAPASKEIDVESVLYHTAAAAKQKEH